MKLRHSRSSALSAIIGPEMRSPSVVKTKAVVSSTFNGELVVALQLDHWSTRSSSIF